MTTPANRPAKGWLESCLLLLSLCCVVQACGGPDASPPTPDDGSAGDMSDTSNDETGAGGEGNVGTGENEPESSLPATSFSSIQEVLLIPRCGGCHGSSGGLTLDNATAYAELVSTPENDSPACNGMLRVDPGKPEESVLIRRLEGASCGAQMPKSGNFLTDSQIDVIRDWIAAGAPDN